MSKKLVSWNVNGLRACVSKGCFQEFMDKENPDVICLQETKLSEGQIEMYHHERRRHHYELTGDVKVQTTRVVNKLHVLGRDAAAALMSILVVLRPWLAHVIGAGDRASEILLPLKNDMPKTSSATRLLRGHLDFTDGVVSFAEHPGRGNGNIASFADCELIGIIPGNAGPLQKGDLIRALRLPAELC